MRIILAPVVAALAGCMTIDKLPTAGTYDVFDTACMSKTANFELQQAALKELSARGLTCREAAMQVLQIRAANPRVFAPAPTFQQQPYVMPTQQPMPRAPEPTTAHGTLIAQRPTTSASGQAAYVCQYRTSTGMAQTIQIASEGPCPPTASLR